MCGGAIVVRKLSLALVLILLVSAIAGCVAEESTFPASATDASGREVSLDVKPESIVSGNYIITSMLLSLGLKDRLTGVEAKAGQRNIYRLAAPELIELPSVGSMKEFSIEAVVALNPDLAVLPLKLRDAADTLNEMGITTVVVNTESYEDLLSTLTLLGTLTGTDADTIVDYYTEMQAMMAEKTAGIEKKRVYLSGNSDFLLTAGKAMFQDTLLTMAGGENVASEIEDTYWASISYEQLLAYDPEVIIMAADAAYTREDLMNDPLLQGVAAIQNGEVYALPSGVEAWDSPVPASILGSLWIMNKLYPEVYTGEELFSEIDSFYEKFYGISVTEELLMQ